MKKQLITLTLGVALATGVHAQEQDNSKRNEMIGFGSGAALGAVIAGPVGAIFGGVFGLFVADDVNDTDKLTAMGEKLQQREQQLIALNREMQDVKQQAQMQLVSMDREIEKVFQEIEASIQFRTASYLLEDHYKQQLDLVAEGLKANPDMALLVAGYADRRGDDSYNQALSEQRAISVKNYLLDKGVSKQQIQTQSFGEQGAVSAGTLAEDNYFDRRVVLKLNKRAAIMTAAN